MTDKQIDEVSGVETTGHEWDGIRELDNPMPRWWLWTFYATIVWALAYVIAYPAWPLISNSTAGLIGWSSRGDFWKENAAITADRQGIIDQIKAKDVHEILADENLRQYAIAGGAAAFRVNCVQCHGSGAQGAPGYPNLNDDDWLWGGSVDDILTTIRHGVRSPDDSETRVSEMPGFADVLEPAQIRDVAAYVVSLSGTSHDPAMVPEGQKVFAENCAVCHGADAKGLREFGAPNLTDAIWFYGSGEDAIARQVARPKHGVMPAWETRLGDATVKQLAIFVHSLGGGE
ncbi:cytochrome-c oxidase, cbb3-type subunit III [Ochrobactrum sp. MYb15]|uniref:cytochrome-c oxidase, cbb3-type subunit III n=1 Tax=Brucella TaxID=234 RepID=UPI000466360E|nr:cytochrome-c oxidase, cbb3-type subunit III [Brucella rhizosphaerae]PQZ49370.1 cytochrome-c oxidase, cbb3-type subunit III [Ochrobactrum sp. MYb19]PRA66813.1 cytochrome-c oxidase, cbb3-type subunit III [Ochrobactrum sp. MYb18]PRA76159.1 cytochrome-c oxidase, cbb3-type subunit III [Brucella thiophenivorans]PRA91822.1 cytochrome-c oxidase, cbb3-type subunit III [Ochrobactrum sp. MYb14]PRA98166.1 cytochrome-c oxidase, cbb3-type subunit III [Ochrobactrum sp. MYb15]